MRNDPDLARLLSRGPNHILTPKRISFGELTLDASRFRYHTLRTWVREHRFATIMPSKTEYFEWLEEVNGSDFKALYRPLEHGTDWDPLFHKAKAKPKALTDWLATWTQDFKEQALRISSNPPARRTSTKHLEWGNLSKGEFEWLQFLRNHKHEFGYGMADKNLGPVLYSRKIYEDHARKWLVEGPTFRPLDAVTPLSTAKYIRLQYEQLERACTKWHRRYGLPRYLRERFTDQPGRPPQEDADYDKLAEFGWSLQSFYLIFKLHKNPVDTRPISSNMTNPFTNLHRWVCHQLLTKLKPVAKCLTRSADIFGQVERLNEMGFRAKDMLGILTADVSKLYPTIPQHSLLAIAIPWFIEHYMHCHPKLRGVIVEASVLLVKHAYISAPGFGIFQQIVGVPTGGAASVAFAKIFVLWQFHDLVEQYQDIVLFHGFFLDDGIWLVRGSRDRLSEMVAQYDSNPNLELTWSASPQDTQAQQEAVFLDATLRVKAKDGTHGNIFHFTHSLYQKPFSTRTYISPSSFHPRHVSKGIAKAELIRILTASSDISQFFKSARSLCGDLRALGYSRRRLGPMLGQVGWEDRKAIGRPRPTIAKSKRLYFSTIFRPGTKELEAAVNWNIPLDVQQGLACGRRVIMARRMGPRLGAMIGKVPRYLEGEALPFNPNLGPP